MIGMESPNNAVQDWQKVLRKRLQSCWIGTCNLSFAAILLGTALNVLETFSIGLLIFPPAEQHGAFSGIQIQAMSLYIASTIISQLVLTLGGSAFPSALGSAFAGVLPFLRGIASRIQQKLGDEHPGVLPTTLAAYAMTSLLLGTVFIILGVLKCGSLVWYFPQTVMTGVIGAVGVSLSVLGLEVTLPTASPRLSLATGADALLKSTHVPLLMSSVVPAILLSISIRFEIFARATSNATQHALYVPVFCFAVAGVFWIAVLLRGNTSAEDLAKLASTGWLFTTQLSPRHQSAAMGWNYWALFDFAKVEWEAVSAASSDIVLLLLIGTLSLPIFLRATASALDVITFSMNRELLGNGIANLLAGLSGTVPNLVIYSNTKFFAIAGGGRAEAAVVVLFTIGLFFVASHLLPYVPTIQASTLLLFIGNELVIDALWDSTRSFAWYEWVTAVGTTLACSLLGFAPGIGVGLAITITLQFWLHLVDSYPRITQPCALSQDEIETDEEQGRSPHTLPPLPVSYPITLSKEIDSPAVEQPLPVVKTSLYAQMQPPIIHLIGRVSFAELPIIERFVGGKKASKRDTTPCIIVDFRSVTAIETCVARFLARQRLEFVRQSQFRSIFFVGLACNPKVQVDLARGGFVCRSQSGDINAEPQSSHRTSSETLRDKFYEQLEDAVRVCRYTSREDQQNDISALIQSIAREVLFYLPPSRLPAHRRMALAGLKIRKVAQGESIACSMYPWQPVFLVLEGKVSVRAGHPEERKFLSQRSIRDAVKAIWKELYVMAKMWISEGFHRKSQPMPAESYLAPDEVFGLSASTFSCAHALTKSCWILDVDPTNLSGLAVVNQLKARENSKSKF